MSYVGDRFHMQQLFQCAAHRCQTNKKLFNSNAAQTKRKQLDAKENFNAFFLLTSPTRTRRREFSVSTITPFSLSLSFSFALSGQAFHHPGTHFQASHANTRTPGNCFPSAPARLALGAPSFFFRPLLPLPLPSAGQLNVESHSH